MTSKTISFTTPLDRPCVFATFRIEGDVPRVGDKFVRRDNGCWQQEIFTGEFHNFFDDELKAKLEEAYRAKLAEVAPGSVKVQALPSPEHHGDWHDKPLKWIVLGPSKEAQKFATRKEAELYARIRRKSPNFNHASRAFAQS
jgi:hypothetical protein